MGQYAQYIILGSIDTAAKRWIEYAKTKAERKQDKQEEKDLERSDRNRQLLERYG